MSEIKYTALETITTSSTVTSITFDAIPSGYRDLMIVMEAAGTSGSRYGFEVFFNNDSTLTNYRRTRLAYESSFYSDTANAPIIPVFSPEKGLFILHVMDYAQTDKFKSVLLRGNVSGVTNANYTYLDLSNGHWVSTAAISSIQVIEAGGGSSIAAGSTFMLYGVK